ncbi:MAG: 4Fe-4S dicluster domain-containing protein [Chloroflexi bacterium]|nr:MAG: 4Fe-4S dicluster domain-containing protein [Chloroflexota bacterium]
MALHHSAVRPEDLATCISCGLCLNDCPTYRVLAEEADSPRGRIQLIRGLVTSAGAPDRRATEHLEACLVCRACETACPSGVPFGRIMEGARDPVGRPGPPGEPRSTRSRTRESSRSSPALPISRGVSASRDSR